jgi:exosortase/archaeosortase family protein
MFMLSQIKNWHALKGIVYFTLAVLLIHVAWKLTVRGDDQYDEISWLGMDVSPAFNAAATRVTDWTFTFLPLFAETPVREPLNVLLFENGYRLHIVWSCTGIKQAVIFLLLMLFYPGPWKRKAWYIPIGLVLLWWFNIVRITLIAAAFSRNPDSFEFLHEHLFKYLYYALIFLLWMVWEEKLAHPKQ